MSPEQAQVWLILEGWQLGRVNHWYVARHPDTMRHFYTDLKSERYDIGQYSNGCGITDDFREAGLPSGFIVLAAKHIQEKWP